MVTRVEMNGGGAAADAEWCVSRYRRRVRFRGIPAFDSLRAHGIVTDARYLPLGTIGKNHQNLELSCIE